MFCNRIGKRTKYTYLTAWMLIFLLLFSAVSPVSAAEASDPGHQLYAGPAESSAALCTFANGDTVTVLENVNTSWSRIRLADGSTGYCDRSLLGLQEAEEEETSSLVKTSKPLRVYLEPDENAPVLTRAAANVRMQVIAEDYNGFSRVLLRCGKTGYVQTDLLKYVYEQPALVRTVPELSPTGVTTEEEAKARLEELSLYFQDGKYWNCLGTGIRQSKEDLFCVTDRPCAHKYNGYRYCNIYNGAFGRYFPQYGTTMQCLGYASLISDLVFGTDAPVERHRDFSRVRVGDHIRLYYWEHSMIVTEVGTDEDGALYVCVTEVNADYQNCKIEWGRKITQQDLRRKGDLVYIYTRYPSEDQAVEEQSIEEQSIEEQSIEEQSIEEQAVEEQAIEEISVEE